MKTPLPSRTILQTPWFRFVAKSADPAAPENLHYVVEPPDYVTMLTLTPSRQVVMVRQFRPSVEDSTLEFPSGTVDPGESPIEAARRELIEETGHGVTRLEELGALWTDTGRLSNRLWCYYAEVTAEPVQAVQESGLRVEYVAFADLLADLKGERLLFAHALNVAALALARLNGHVNF